MRKTITGIAAAAVSLLAPGVAATAANASLVDPPAGIYVVHGADSLVNQPYVMGGQITLQWPAIEPSKGVFDWSSLDSELAAYHAMGKPATVQINSTTAKPSWLWNVVARCGKVSGQDAPQYWDPAYMPLEQQLITALAAHLQASPYRSSVALVRSASNFIGTELTDLPSGYTCTRTPSGHISNVAWTKTIRNQMYLDVMGLYRSAFQATTIPVAMRAQLFTQWPQNSPMSWLGASNGNWIMGTASDTDPNPVRDAFDAFALQHDWAGDTQAYWEPIQETGHQNLVSWNFWRILMELDKGVSYIAVYGQEVANGSNVEYQSAFDFANRYAGHQSDPLTSPGAWVALRQGSGKLAGNYSWMMQQYSPSTTSVALDSNQGQTMIGPATQRFGRYARRIDGGTSMDTMSFQLNPAFRTGIAGQPCHLNVWYLSDTTGQFKVTWGTQPGESTVVTKTGVGAWRKVSIPVNGSSFAGGLPNASDISLQALGTDKTIFHMVELSVDGR